jgi:hypothetical protein
MVVTLDRPNPEILLRVITGGLDLGIAIWRVKDTPLSSLAPLALGVADIAGMIWWSWSQKA